MPADGLNMDEILAQMSEKFLETAQEKLIRLNEILQELSDPTADEAALVDEFKREVHSLKGMGGTFQKPLITKLCHKFEDYLSASGKFSENVIADCYTYLDRMSDLLDGEQKGNRVEEQDWLSGLPGKSTESMPNSVNSVSNVLVIANSPEITQEITPLLEDSGLNVASAISAFRGYKAAVTQCPDVLIIAQKLDEMDGAELIRSLGSMRALSKAKIAMICPDRKAALSENLQGVHLLSEKNIAIDVMNFISVVVTA